MNKITTYDDLLKERERLTLELEIHKAAVRSDIELVKQRLEPLKHVISFLRNFTSPLPDNTLFSTGLSLSLEMIIRKLFFAKTGWITRLVGPVLVKNLGANVVMKNKRALIKKVRSLLHLDGKD